MWKIAASAMRRSNDLLEADPKQGGSRPRGFNGDQVFPRERETGCLDVRGGYRKVCDQDLNEPLAGLHPERRPSEGGVSEGYPIVTLPLGGLTKIEAWGHQPGSWPTQRLMKIRI